MGKLKASLGSRFSFALYNRYDGYRRSTTTSFTGVASSSGTTDIRNLWTAINRFQIEGTFNLSYRINKYELGINASKRFNNLIKDNIAEKRKSNVPIQFGMNITRYF